MNAQTGNVEFTASTPRTDANEFDHRYKDTARKMVYASFARQLETELAAAKAERERTLQANYVIREQQKEDFARAEKAEAALAEANRKLAEFEQYALNYLWIINDNCGENTADDAVSAVELLLNTDMTSEQLHAAITSARKGESVWN